VSDLIQIEDPDGRTVYIDDCGIVVSPPELKGYTRMAQPGLFGGEVVTYTDTTKRKIADRVITIPPSGQ
jgi:hypothetical protein